MDDQKQTVTLTAYQWSTLLDEMRERMCVVNRDQTTNIELYQEIATQLNGGNPVRVEHPQNPDPQFRPKEKPKPDKFTGSGFFRRLLG